MKTSKSPQNTDVTPSKKKLRQARLPFKLLSDVSPKPVTPQTRKRKLSPVGDETTPKVGKTSKENDVITDTVVISDDDSGSCDKVQKEEKKPMNPYVKLVDTVLRKKQKAKKKQSKKKTMKVVENGNESATDSVEDIKTDCELMDVDETPITEVNCSTNDSEKTSEDKKISEVNGSVNDKSVCNHEVILLEESNNSSDVKTPNNVEDTETDHNDSKTDSDSECSTNTEKKNENDEKDTLNKSDEVKVDTPVTPKRSSRNKVKVEQNNNLKKSPSAKLSESVTANPITPKHSRSSSATNSQGDVSMNESTPSANLTPRQLQKKLESAKKKEEREKEKIERDKKKQEEKEDKAKARLEKEEQRKKEKEEKEEAKRKEREEKEEQRKKEKEEKEKQKELEKKQREEKEEQRKKEREEKDEQKRKEKEAKDEERRKKQEAVELEKQEAELKKKKAAEALAKFLVTKQKSDKDQATISSVSKNSMLSNFTIKTDMRLAPLVRTNLTNQKRHTLDCYLEKQNSNEESLYLKGLRNGISKPLSSGKTWPYNKDDDDDIMIVEDELPPIDAAGEILTCDSAQREKLRPKLLSFHDNRRPPYWGTWRKKSAAIKPRKPFGQDEKQLDYEADSDEEWEEEQEGESIDGSAAGSDDEQDGDEYELDNAMFVPHGYLSDEEATMDEDDVLSLSPETQKARLKHLEDEFESEMKKPTEKLKPRMYGLLWETAEGGKPEKCVDALWNYFGKLSMILNDPTLLLQPSNEPEETEKKKVKKKKAPAAEGEQKSPKNEKKKKAKTEEKEGKSPKVEAKKSVADTKKNQPGINKFLTKLKSS